MLALKDHPESEKDEYLEMLFPTIEDNAITSDMRRAFHCEEMDRLEAINQKLHTDFIPISNSTWEEESREDASSVKGSAKSEAV